MAAYCTCHLRNDRCPYCENRQKYYVEIVDEHGTVTKRYGPFKRKVAEARREKLEAEIDTDLFYVNIYEQEIGEL